MLELEIKPYVVKFQRQTKAGKWIGLYELRSEAVLTDTELCIKAENEQKLRGQNIRVLSSRGNQILTTCALGFYYKLRFANLISVKLADKPDPIMLSQNNILFKPYTELQSIIQANKGIRKAKLRKFTAEDGFLFVYNVTFNNGETCSVTCYR